MPSLVLESISLEEEDLDHCSKPILQPKSTPFSCPADEVCNQPPSSITPPTEKKSAKGQKANTAKKPNVLVSMNQKSIASFFGAGKSTGSNTKRPPFRKDQVRRAKTPHAISTEAAKEALRDIVVGVCSPIIGKKSLSLVHKVLPQPQDVLPPLSSISRIKLKTSLIKETETITETRTDASNHAQKESSVDTAQPDCEVDSDDATIIVIASDDDETDEQDATVSFEDTQVQESLDEIEAAPPSSIPEEMIAVRTLTSTSTSTGEEERSVPIKFPSERQETAKKKTVKMDDMVLMPKTTTKKEITNPDDALTLVPTVTLAPERVTAMAKNDLLRQKYMQHVFQLTRQGQEGIAEEQFEIPKADQPPITNLYDESFPEGGVVMLASMVQECRLPLSTLANVALSQLQKSFPKLSIDCITAKIKVLASRESYVKGLPGQTAQNKTNTFEDTDATRMWRWEVIILELLPEDVIPKIKKARIARRKRRSHALAIGKLLTSLNSADKLLKDDKSAQDKCDLILTKISNEEEKLLKFEREAEKVRLIEEAKKNKANATRVEKKEAQTVKAVVKHIEAKAQQEADRLKKKEEAAALKEETKLKKQSEREERDRMSAIEKQHALSKNKARLLSFFSTDLTLPKGKSPIKNETPLLVATNSVEAEHHTSKFWSLIDSSCDDLKKKPLFESLTNNAKRSRRRRTGKVSINVYITVMPDDQFTSQPYADLQTIQVPNKYKFLSFEEDYRPAYHGTWSRTSTIVTGRNPFGRDTSVLNYDVDSEEEWEEGDDEIGEDLEANDNDDEEENVDAEEGDTSAYNFQDGWMAEDDDVIYEDGELDEDAKTLRKAVLKASDSRVEQSSLCVMSPTLGGFPLAENKGGPEGVEGVIDAAAAFEMAILNTDQDIVIDEAIYFLDMEFPPDLVEEVSVQIDDQSTPTTAKAVNTPEMSTEHLRDFARFVHHSKLPSKDQLVEQLRMALPNVTSSRAQATRKLDAIAMKQRNPLGGTAWIVKECVLKELNLHDLMQMRLEEPAVTELKTIKKAKTTKSQCDEPASTPSPSSKVMTEAKEVGKSRNDSMKKQGKAKGSKRKAAKSAVENSGKRSKVTLDKVETTCENIPCTSSAVSPSCDKKRKSAPSGGSVQLFAAFLAGKKVKTARES